MPNTPKWKPARRTPLFFKGHTGPIAPAHTEQSTIDSIGVHVSFDASQAKAELGAAQLRAELFKGNFMELVRVATMVTTAFFTLQMMHMRQGLVAKMQQYSHLRVEMAKKAELKAVMEYGLHSPEAQKGAREVSMAQNTQERTTVRIRMLQQREVMMIATFGIQGMTTLARLMRAHEEGQAAHTTARTQANATQMAKNTRLSALRTAQLAITVASIGIAAVATLGLSMATGIPGLDVATSAGFGDTPIMHSGGIAKGGPAWLERGETVGHQGLRTYYLRIKPFPGTEPKRVAQELWDTLHEIQKY